MLFYAVDRTSGAPREGVQIQMVQAANTIQTGTTDKQGLYKTKIEKKKKPATEDESDAEVDATPDPNAVEPPPPAYLMMATAGENFAISDLDTFYFEEDASGGEGGEGEYEGDYGGGSSSDVKSYIYTDRPVYRPQQRGYFKGILRSVTENGYKLLPGKSVDITVSDGDGASIYEKTLPLSSRGTFSGDLDIGEDAPLGTYTIKAVAVDKQGRTNTEQGDC